MRESGNVIGSARIRDKVERVRPTLLIGLGGTGREVLLRVRQRFVERYGAARFPCTAYLWIDTDVDNSETVEGRPRDFISSEARLQTSEMLDATITADQFLSYFEHSQQNRHIFSWIYPGVRKSGAVLHGARAVRPLGRLAFFHHVDAIRRRILSAAADVSDARRRDEMRERYGIEVATDGLSVYVVFSVAGGTGSGMFLDMAFLLRHLGREGSILSPNITGFLVLPPVFTPTISEHERLYANAYASLKELEYYSMRKDQRHDPVGSEHRIADVVREVSAHDFVVDWFATGRPLSVVGPPFNSCFLVSNAPSGGAPVPGDRKGDVFDMIAENVFVDFARQDFAVRKRSLRSNLEDFLKNELEYGYLDGDEVVFQDVFSFRFSAFGLSKVFVPTDRIRRACGYRLGVELLDRWLAENPVPGDLRSYLDQHEVDELGWRVSRQRDALREQLDRMDDGGQTVTQLVQRHWLNTKRDELRALVAAERPGLKAALEGELIRFHTGHFNKPENQARWGTVIRRLHLTTGPALQANLESRLEERLHEWLNTPRVRLSGAREYFKVLHQILADLEQAFQKAADARRQRAADTLAEWQRLLEFVDEEETQGLWKHRWGLRALVEEACETAARHFDDLGYAEVYGVAAEICAALQRHVGSERVEVDRGGQERTVRSGLFQRLFFLREELQRLREEQAARLAAFDRGENHLIFVNLYQPGMFQRFYQLVRPDGSAEPLDERVLGELEVRLRDELEVVSPYDLVARIADLGAASVRDQLERFCARRFERMDARNADALLLLEELAQEGRVERDTVQRLVENGVAWLSPNRRAGEGGSPLGRNYAVAALLGIHHAQRQHPRYESFEALVAETAARIPALKSQPVGAVDTERDAVFFYTELAGLPLAYVEHLESYRDAYRAQIEEHLHLDRHTDRFADIVLKKPEEVRVAVGVTRAILLGIILRVLEVSGEGNDATLHYVDVRKYPRYRRQIGTRLDAFELLASDTQLLDTIQADIDERVRRLGRERSEQFHVLLTYHVMDGSVPGAAEVGPFAPRDVRVGNARAVKVPIENHAVHQELRAVERRLEDRTGADPKVLRDRIFAKWYPRRHEFAEEVRVGGDVFLAFSQPPTEPDAPEGEEQFGDVFAKDYV